MTEQESRETLNPGWKEAIKQGIYDALDNYELLGQVNVAPASIAGGIDERGFPELSPHEQQFIAKILFSALGVDLNTEYTSAIVEYKMQAPEGASWKGVANVEVFATFRSDENMFLHGVKFPDGKVDFVVAPKDFRL